MDDRHGREESSSRRTEGLVAAPWMMGEFARLEEPELVHGNWTNSNDPVGHGWAEAGSSERRRSCRGAIVGWSLASGRVYNQRAAGRWSLGLGGGGGWQGCWGMAYFGRANRAEGASEARKSKTEQVESGREVPASCDVLAAPSPGKPLHCAHCRELLPLSEGRYWRVSLELRNDISAMAHHLGYGLSCKIIENICLSQPSSKRLHGLRSWKDAQRVPSKRMTTLSVLPGGSSGMQAWVGSNHLYSVLSCWNGVHIHLVCRLEITRTWAGAPVLPLTSHVIVTLCSDVLGGSDTSVCLMVPQSYRSPIISEA